MTTLPTPPLEPARSPRPAWRPWYLSRLVLARLIPRRFVLGDALVLLLLGLAVYGLTRLAAEWRAPPRAATSIDLSLAVLPLYTFFSLCRGVAAFVLSFFFTLVYGYIAARVRHADRLMLPLLDILQSIPVLGFMPGVVLGLATLFPNSNAGVELAAIVMIFTGQVWNMTFSFYHSLRAIPADLLDASRLFGFGRWRRLSRVELPFAAVGLVWNGMMSMAGGWFFLTVSEAFRLGEHDFRLPGIGAYMSAAIDAGDGHAMVAAVVAMITMIVLLDQLFWRPLAAWAERFKIEDVGGEPAPTSWALELFKRTRLYDALRRLAHRLHEAIERAPRRVRAPASPTVTSSHVALVVGLLVLLLLGIAGIVGTALVGSLIARLDLREWLTLGKACLLTLLRTTGAVALGTLWTVPVGLYLGTRPRVARLLQPVVQIAASFPAPMLFPAVLLVLDRAGAPLGLSAVVLMAIGTQWYILFNVMAGAVSIPQQLYDAASIYKLGGAQRWRLLLLPGIFPQLVTGWVTAAGGAWNASIVAEYIHVDGRERATDGLGALISLAASRADMPLLAASVLTMAVVVVLVNRLFWRRLYRLAERRFALI